MPFKFNPKERTISRLPDMEHPSQGDYLDGGKYRYSGTTYDGALEIYKAYVKKLPIYKCDPDLLHFLVSNGRDGEVFEGIDFKLVHDYPIGGMPGTMAVKLNYQLYQLPAKKETNIKVVFQEGVQVSDTNLQGCMAIATIDKLTVCVTGEDKLDAFKEALISVCVMLAHNSGITPDQLTQVFNGFSSVNIQN